MKFSFIAFTCIAASMILHLSCAHSKNAGAGNRDAVVNIDQHLSNAAGQYKVMMKNLSGDRFPRSYDPKTDKFITSGSGWWCSGFYPGTLLYLYEQTKDQALYAEAGRILNVLEKEKE